METVGFELEELEFKYQRLTSVLHCIHVAADQDDDKVAYALYEVVEELTATNARLKETVENIIHRGTEK